MIVQESRIKTRSGYQAVSRHVLSGPKNEAIRILSGSDYLLKDWMKEAKREGIRYGLRHIAFNPSEHMSDGQLTHFANQICQELGADPDRLTLVIHQKDGSTHGHLLLPEWQDDHVLSSRFTWQRLEKIARLEELRLGHDLIPGRHDKAIAKTLREAGNSEAADRIAVLVPEEHADRPVSAYTSQARRITERQDFDLAAARREIMAFWEKSGNDLKTFRRFLKTKNWHMRPGDRTDRRRDAHVIETDDGMLIGSFTRLTKVRMKDFRLLLEEEAARPSPVDLRPVVKRLERRETRHQQREERKRKNEDLIWAPPDPLSVLDRQRLQEHGRKEVDMIRKRLPSIGSPRYPEQFSEGFQIYLKDWKREMQAARAVLNARHPLERRYGPESPLDIQTACILQMMREGWVKLKQANQTIAQARQRLDELEARKSPFFRKSRISEAEEQYRQALAQLAEILRYLVQFILYHLGLSSQKPDPIQIPVPTEREVTWQDYLQDRRELLQTLLDEKTRRVWIKDRCREAEHRRAHVIAQWHADRVQDCDQAQQTVARLEQLARLPRQLPEEIRFAIRDLKRQGQFRKALQTLCDFRPSRPVPRSPLTPLFPKACLYP
ncbi:hypothetical protein [Gluconobacter sphaericus]|uniref:Uncharacterized protein n=1 Tax=Gluconobacter sphaericus NBRC 12467 TaxID=1307951 RepID=A0AA37WB17_9PROT|nr:hypothetical protein [Gluconobacter sphaericus]GBR55833.1 hypothetical protein AA12467_2296 [Gluconobacter sphaericus NBRC 12467]GEB43928.1 hypothetical protein GSP01_27100 [Gluconobacter sphaericus NBRC 12467]GLQ85672.1 hypothetical protein GCM10007872_25820 [Gluconobacter sphaericus NBRC 12467]